jgi:flagellar hook-associated protein 1 FlgK
MVNYGGKILNNSVRSLNAQQAIIANTSNNIANVNTPGYSRRVVTLENAVDSSAGSGTFQLGNGVQLQGVTRMADEYLNKLVQTQTGKQASSELQDSFVSRVEQLFSLTGDTGTLTKDINAFFTSLNDLTINPSSIETRKVVLEKAQSLVTSISSTYNTVADLQREADQRIGTEVQSVNRLLEQIAQANGNVAGIERAGPNQVASDDRDKRDSLLNELSKKLSFNSVENADGSVNIYLPNGFTLVGGVNSYPLRVTSSPSFAAGSQPPSLGGEVLSSVTYDYSNGSGTADYDLTQALQNGDGSIGALLKLRGYNNPTNTSAFQADGFLVEVASRVEALAQDLLTRFNTTYLGADEDSATAGFQSNALDLNGNTPSTYGFFDFSFSGVKDANGNGLPDDLPALSVVSYARSLTLAISDPRSIAAARDQNPTGGALALVKGNGDNIQALVGLRNASTTFSAGNFSLTGTYDDLYNETIAHVSSEKSAIVTKASLDKNYLITVQSQRDEFSAVSLDEEFSNLIRFQKAYQASAKMIKIADDLLTTVIQLI